MANTFFDKDLDDECKQRLICDAVQTQMKKKLTELGLLGISTATPILSRMDFDKQKGYTLLRPEYGETWLKVVVGYHIVEITPRFRAIQANIWDYIEVPKGTKIWYLTGGRYILDEDMTDSERESNEDLIQSGI